MKENKLVTDLLLFIFGASIFAYFIFSYWSIFFPFAIAIIFAYLLNPLVNYFSYRYDFSRLKSVLIIYLFLALTLFLSFYFLIPKLIKEIINMQQNMPSYISFIQINTQTLISRLQSIFPFLNLDGVDIVAKASEKMESNFVDILKNIPLILQSVASFFMIVLFVPFITFFLLKDASGLKNLVYELIPNRYYELFRNLSARMDQQLGNYIRGQLLDAVILGVLSTIGLLIIQVKYAMIIGPIAGLANLIPYFGPVMGMIPALLVTIVERGFSLDIIGLIVVVFFIIQIIDNLFVAPLVVGSSVNLHPLVVMIAIMVGGAMGGLFAMLLVVPFVSIVRIVVVELFNELKYRKYLKIKKLREG